MSCGSSLSRPPLRPSCNVTIPLSQLKHLFTFLLTGAAQSHWQHLNQLLNTEWGDNISNVLCPCLLISFLSWSSLQVSPTPSSSLRIVKLIGWRLKRLCARQTLPITSCVLISCAHMWCQSSSAWQRFATFPRFTPSTKYVCFYLGICSGITWTCVCVFFCCTLMFVQLGSLRNCLKYLDLFQEVQLPWLNLQVTSPGWL